MSDEKVIDCKVDYKMPIKMNGNGYIFNRCYTGDGRAVDVTVPLQDKSLSVKVYQKSYQSAPELDLKCRVLKKEKVGDEDVFYCRDALDRSVTVNIDPNRHLIHMAISPFVEVDAE